MADSRNNPSTEPVLRAVATTLARHVKHGSSLVVGYSGGLDSTVLLHAVHFLAGNSGHHLAARHVHHGLSERADTWEVSCARFCQGLGVPLDVVRVQIPDSLPFGLEAGGSKTEA